MRSFRYPHVLPVALLALFCGLCLGRVSTGNNAAAGRSAGNDGAVPAMASSWEEPTPFFSTGTGEPALSAPAVTPENLFSMTVVTDGYVPPVATAAPAAVSETPAPATPTPPPGFSLQVVRQPESAARKRRVLIYHTHTYEAYEKLTPEEYQETQQWRTADEKHNVLRVGEELAGLLRGLGFEAEHDQTAFEPPELSTAYARSLQMLEQRRGDGESYDLYIDLHRDAYAASSSAANTVNAGGMELARLMLLVGRGEGQTAQGLGEKPDWESNLLIAQRITEGLNAQAPGLCKDVMLKSGRYNQHVAVGCVLIEVGNNLNTLPQALAAMPYLADAIDGAIPAGGSGNP